MNYTFKWLKDNRLCEARMRANFSLLVRRSRVIRKLAIVVYEDVIEGENSEKLQSHLERPYA